MDDEIHLLHGDNAEQIAEHERAHEPRAILEADLERADIGKSRPRAANTEPVSASAATSTGASDGSRGLLNTNFAVTSPMPPICAGTVGSGHACY
jgi:hypothetical protein